MSHLFSALFFLAVMAASIRLIAVMLADSRDRIMFALGGSPKVTMRPMATVNFINFARRNAASPRVTRSASTPLRAAA